MTVEQSIDNFMLMFMASIFRFPIFLHFHSNISQSPLLLLKPISWPSVSWSEYLWYLLETHRWYLSIALTRKFPYRLVRYFLDMNHYFIEMSHYLLKCFTSNNVVCLWILWIMSSWLILYVTWAMLTRIVSLVIWYRFDMKKFVKDCMLQENGTSKWILRCLRFDSNFWKRFIRLSKNKSLLERK